MIWNLPLKEVRLGLRANLAQFSLLVLVNAFVGAVVGMEWSKGVTGDLALARSSGYRHLTVERNQVS